MEPEATEITEVTESEFSVFSVISVASTSIFFSGVSLFGFSSIQTRTGRSSDFCRARQICPCGQRCRTFPISKSSNPTRARFPGRMSVACCTFVRTAKRRCKKGSVPPELASITRSREPGRLARTKIAVTIETVMINAR